VRDELYFIAVFTEALHRPDRRAALTKAFHEIKRLGRQPRYQMGFDHFAAFMGQVVDRDETLSRESSRHLMLERAAQIGDINIDTGGKEWFDPEQQDEWETIRTLLGPSRWSLGPVIDLFCGRRKINRLIFSQDHARQSVTGLLPGGYVLKLNTGWVLLKEQLTAEDMFWKEAYGGEDLKLAAANAEASQKPTRQIVLLNGQLTVSCFAGLASGSLEIHWGGADGNG